MAKFKTDEEYSDKPIRQEIECKYRKSVDNDQAKTANIMAMVDSVKKYSAL